MQHTAPTAMNFVPFIAIDNHKRSIVVGAALISHEKTENYEWPKFVIIDQCPAIKQAIPKVLTDSNHRLCALHIMKSWLNKVLSDNNANFTYKRNIKRLVWSLHVTIEEFETEWVKIVNDYDFFGRGIPDRIGPRLIIGNFWAEARLLSMQPGVKAPVPPECVPQGSNSGSPLCSAQALPLG
ncbi:hypothetical protein OSB04_025049 [Centaurea solstitialis]|uniref:Protein FAR1-RELATED SEQUENCE n=1 Tax=Centaurea solstitialis TaxID=347529 RepID=A0AA38W3P0_9ASTR|nr:hypothetical protein OSB04_025049 [Centaurea solstitialis]